MRPLLTMDSRKRILNFSIRAIKDAFQIIFGGHSNDDLKVEFSNLFFFLPSVIDRSEEVNNYLNNVTIKLVDMN